MESMYHQWPGMTIDKDYETSLVKLCVEALRYLDTVYTYKYVMGSFSADILEEIMQNINKADTACRGFSVTIVQDVLQRTLDELEDDDSDSDETVKIQCGVKRRIEDISDQEDDSDGTAVGTQEVMAVKQLPRAKRVKI
jgi:aminopeptidase-like protein